MSVVGFLTYQDFLIELKQLPKNGTTGRIIRVQDYYRIHHVPQMPASVKFFVLIAVDTGPDVLVCRLLTGSAKKYDRENVARMERRNKWAAWMIKDNLEKTLGGGFEIRPGIIAASQKSETEANSDWLWKATNLQTKKLELVVGSK